MRSLIILPILFFAYFASAQKTEITAMYSADANHDGFSDILVMRSKKKFDSLALYGAYTTIGRNISLYLGTPSGLDTSAQWTLIENENEGFPFLYNFSYDIDHDGYNDILGISYLNDKKKAYKAVLVYYHTPIGYSKKPVIISPNLPDRKDWDGYFTDINSDGHVDIIVNSYGFVPNLSIRWPTNFKTYVIYGNGKGFDEAMISLIPEIQAMNLNTSYDFDGNKLEDVFITGTEKQGHDNDQTFLLLAQRNQPPVLKNWLSLKTRLFVNEQYKYNMLGDINGDGKDDVSIEKQESKKNVRKHNMSPFTISIFTGADSGLNTKPFESFNATNWNGFMKIGDFDGDGYDDLLSKCPNCETNYIIEKSPIDLRKYFLYWGSKTSLVMDITFSQSLSILADKRSVSFFSVGDLNGDKKADLIITSSNGNYIIYGNAERTFLLQELKF